MSNKWVIGDLHGGLRGLEQLLERAPLNEADELIFLGDYVDGWSDSAELVGRLLTLEQKYACIFIKGNHDLFCYNWLAQGEEDEVWLRHGGSGTIYSYAPISPVVRREHAAFFARLINYYEDESNNLFIHAGFSTDRGPEGEFIGKRPNWDRTLWQTAMTMHERVMVNERLMPKRLKLYQEIFIGHTPTLFFGKDTPMNACNVWNLDTGAAYTGKATIMNVATKQFYQSDPLIQLYPDEKGRN
ncbi:MAG: serine/threonine protein phosphatase [Sphingobacteriales bacterium]|nr:MAG: serine/threonine protein phosphatase [Sphingobacteriales bacterium]